MLVRLRVRRGALDELKALSCLVCKAGRGRRGGRRVWWIDWLVGVGVGLRCTAPPSVDGLQLCRCRLHGRTQRIRSDTSDALIAAAKEVATFDSPRRSLTTSAAACRTWHAALLLLRSGFIADKNLGDVDVPMPGRRPSSTSHAISFVWRPVTALVDSILCVEYIRGRQRKRRTEEARLFCEELGKVLTFLQTPSPASSHISVPFCPLETIPRKGPNRGKPTSHPCLAFHRANPTHRPRGKQVRGAKRMRTPGQGH